MLKTTHAAEKLLALRIYLFRSFAHSGDDHILEHLNIVGIHCVRRDRQGFQLFLAVYDYLNSSAAGRRRELLLLKGLLILFHLALHSLRLFHQIIHIAGHTAGKTASSCHLLFLLDLHLDNIG